MKTRIIIADDHPVVIQGVKDILEKNGAFDVMATFRDGKSLLQSPLLARVDVLLLDLNMPDIDGLQTLDKLRKLGASFKIIVITSYLSPLLAEQCKAAGVHGYLVKSDDLYLLVKRIQDVLAGESVFPDFSQSDQPTGTDFSYFDEFLKKYKLTKREVEIVRMVCNDYSSKEIADKLCLSTFTIQTHRRNIIRKLGLDDSKIALYRFAVDNGVI
ncbi:response regulator transcription factor [Parapedobacter sp. ISTM3]|uniref:Two component transcriptional regulator, LuxR family n=1 Tax=Parapedobacter luteus TaxID=623280 RepID=A0A1T5BJL9_9SPHI|nr:MULTISPECIES: response regulator transcription factor [Parapedobacter]MBK1439465.1 response regulator transcription factor [Parapedobacter sp. ISTM3]SKB47209.1 two component transcriptional regulator, LuxR family [Parapedobacter luteus]